MDLPNASDLFLTYISRYYEVQQEHKGRRGRGMNGWNCWNSVVVNPSILPFLSKCYNLQANDLSVFFLFFSPMQVKKDWVRWMPKRPMRLCKQEWPGRPFIPDFRFEQIICATRLLFNVCFKWYFGYSFLSLVNAQEEEEEKHLLIPTP